MWLSNLQSEHVVKRGLGRFISTYGRTSRFCQDIKGFDPLLSFKHTIKIGSRVHSCNAQLSLQTQTCPLFSTRFIETLHLHPRKKVAKKSVFSKIETRSHHLQHNSKLVQLKHFDKKELSRKTIYKGNATRKQVVIFWMIWIIYMLTFEACAFVSMLSYINCRSLKVNKVSQN